MGRHRPPLHPVIHPASDVVLLHDTLDGGPELEERPALHVPHSRGAIVEHFPTETGTVTGLVGAVGGLGGFFPPLLMGVVHQGTGSYAIGFMLLYEFTLLCLPVNVLVLHHGARRVLAPWVPWVP